MGQILRRARYRDTCVPPYQVKQGAMDYCAALKKVSCQVPVMAGDRDPITPIRFSEEIVRHLPADQVTFRRFADCGHGVTGDQPEAAFEAIRRFVQEIVNATPA